MHHIIFLFQYCIKIIKLLKTANVDCYKIQMSIDALWFFTDMLCLTLASYIRILIGIFIQIAVSSIDQNN